MTNTLLLIDLQKDFHPGGSLAIGTANEDAKRIVDFINSHSANIHQIICTLDTHSKLHIAHPGFWLNDSNEHPSPFTIISVEDLKNKVWKPRSDLDIPMDSLDPDCFPDAKRHLKNGKIDLESYVIEYATRLETAGRFQLCIWPEHCLMGSPGHGLVDSVLLALHRWTETTGRTVQFVQKGQNLLTEMYSAMAADVVVSKDTSFNNILQESLLKASKLFVAGQAMSHCVNYTTRDIVNHWPKERLSDVCLLTDCASAVPGFEGAAETFQSDMEKAGVTLCKSSDPNLL